MTAALGKKKVGARSVTLARAGKHKVIVKFTRKAKKQLKRRRRVTLSITTVVADAANNSARTTKKLTLTR